MSWSRAVRLLGCLLVAGLLWGGCSRQVRVPEEKLTPGTTLGRSRVYLSGGIFYEFRRVRLSPDSLFGEYKVVVEHTVQGEGSYFADEMHTFRCPLARIDSVTVIQKDLGKTVLYGAGFAAVGALIVNMADRGPGPREIPSDGGKGPQP
jgi:hypothetical protein